MNKAQLIIEFAKAKHNTTLYKGDLSGQTYWEGVQSVYQKFLNLNFPGWGSKKGLGKAVWMCDKTEVLDIFPTLLEEY